MRRAGGDLIEVFFRLDGKSLIALSVPVSVSEVPE
jgi:hypothetical protein